MASARTRASYIVGQITSARTRARLKKKFNPIARTRASCFRLQNGPQYSSLVRVRATNSQLSIWLARVRARLAMLHLFLFALSVFLSNLLAFVPFRSQSERCWPSNAGICINLRHRSRACERSAHRLSCVLFSLLRVRASLCANLKALVRVRVHSVVSPPLRSYACERVIGVPIAWPSRARTRVC